MQHQIVVEIDKLIAIVNFLKLLYSKLSIFSRKKRSASKPRKQNRLPKLRQLRKESWKRVIFTSYMLFTESTYHTWPYWFRLYLQFKTMAKGDALLHTDPHTPESPPPLFENFSLTSQPAENLKFYFCGFFLNSLEIL